MVDLPRSASPLNTPVAADTAIMADSELCAVGNIKIRLLSAQAMQQETKGHEEPERQAGDQGNKPLIRRQGTKAAAVLVLNTVAPEMLVCEADEEPATRQNPGRVRDGTAS